MFPTSTWMASKLSDPKGTRGREQLPEVCDANSEKEHTSLPCAGESAYGGKHDGILARVCISEDEKDR